MASSGYNKSTFLLGTPNPVNPNTTNFFSSERAPFSPFLSPGPQHQSFYNNNNNNGASQGSAQRTNSNWGQPAPVSPPHSSAPISPSVGTKRAYGEAVGSTNNQPKPQAIGSGSLSALRGDVAEAGVVIDSVIGSGAAWRDLGDRLGEGDYISPERDRLFSRGVVPLPDQLLQQYDRLECKCFMGIFPEISRAWFTIDNKLFLWNYEERTDFYEYDGLDQIITSVALVAPKPGVFVEEVRHVLVLSTPTEVVLLGVCFSASGVAGEIDLYATQLSVPTDNVNMLKIVGTPEGRIFMAGMDGHLYELDYTQTAGWFAKRIRKINHTAGLVTALIPAFLRMEADPIIDLCYDPTRGALFALTDRSTIHLFDLGPKGDQLTKVSSYSSLAKDLSRTQQPKADASAVVTIHPIPVYESASLCLVATTTSGTRAFFSCGIASSSGSSSTFNSSVAGASSSSSSSSTTTTSSTTSSTTSRPRELKFVMARSPPTVAAPRPSLRGAAPTSRYGSIAPGPPRALSLHLSSYTRGVFLLADSLSEDADALVVISPDPVAECDRVRSRHLLSAVAAGVGGRSIPETVSGVELHGKVWAIEEASGVGDLLRINPDLPVLSEMAVAQAIGRREWLCLTAKGLHRIAQMRPVDMLAQILLASGGQDTPWLMWFFERFGRDQSCALCLEIMCRSAASPGAFQERSMPALPSGPPGSEAWHHQPSSLTQFGGLHSAAAGAPGGGSLPGVGASNSGNLQLYATRAFFKHGGSPVIQEPSTPAFGYTQIGHYVSTPQLVFSGCHDGLAYYLARIVLLRWSTKIVANISALDDYRAAEVQLSALAAFLDKNKTFVTGSASLSNTANNSNVSNNNNNNNTGSSNTVLDARKAEQASLAGLACLVERCLEGIAFVAVLRDQGLRQLMETLTPEVRSRLGGLTFKQLVVTNEGTEVSKLVVSAIMLEHMSRGQSVESVGETLRQRCSGFFSREDLIRYRAYEHMTRAKHASSTVEAAGPLGEALTLFLEIPLDVQISSVCSDFQRLRFYQGVVELALARAKAVDPTGLADEASVSTYTLDQTANINNNNNNNSMYSSFASMANVAGYGGGVSVAAAASSGNMERNRRAAAAARGECYRCIESALAELLSATDAPPGPEGVLATSPRPQLPAAARGPLLEATLARAAASGDRLWHHALYEFLVSGGHTEVLLSLRTPFLEGWLRAAAVSRAGGADMLWKYYLLNKKSAEAVETLRFLAEQQHTDPSACELGRRVEYLGLALSAAKAGGSTNTPADSLNELQERLEVAQIQLKVLREVELLPASDAQRQAVAELNTRLIDISPLYNHYVMPFELWECALAVVDCAGHDDHVLVRKIWTKLLQGEMARALGFEGHTVQIGAIASRIIHLGRLYGHSPRVFPLPVIVDYLEQYSLQTGVREPIDWVVGALKDAGLPMSAVFETYFALYTSRSPAWVDRPSAPGAQLHLLSVLHAIMVSGALGVGPAATRRINEVVDVCLVDLRAQPTHEARSLAEAFSRLRS